MLAVKKRPLSARVRWRILSNYLGMTGTVLLPRPISAEIRTVDSQSDLRIFLWFQLMYTSYIYRYTYVACSLLFSINSKLIARRHKIMHQGHCKIAMLLFHSGCALLINGTNHCNYISLETILKYNLKRRQKRQRKKLLPYNSNI